MYRKPLIIKKDIQIHSIVVLCIFKLWWISFFFIHKRGCFKTKSTKFIRFAAILIVIRCIGLSICGFSLCSLLIYIFSICGISFCGCSGVACMDEVWIVSGLSNS
ncbi:hypothetical protein BDF14DRAFT_695362 [Spinellus fusiger]|nr:hypothetical protein BDF14DRAFT_695362 [Spinellus fusiger]